MKLRSSLLFACMLIVPGIAMFSHKIPPEVRRAMREQAWKPALEMLAGMAGGAPAATENSPLSPPVASPAPPPAADVIAATSNPTPARQPAAPLTAPPARLAPASAFASVPEPARPLKPTADVRSVRSAVESRLADLGAVSFDCLPSPDGGPYRCSCRVAADPSGQLQRVFQSADPDPAAAMQNLLGQVQFWKQRLAARPAGENPLRPAAPGQAAIVR